MQAKIAYIISRFPNLPETFILREMTALERIGWKVSLYPLIVQRQKIVHTEAKPWQERAHRSPWLSVNVLTDNLHFIVFRPHLYFSLLCRVLWENRSSPAFLLRAVALFLKIVFMAKQIKDEGISHIHAHYATHPTLAAWIIHKITGIPFSVTVHAHDIFVDTTMLETKLKDATFVRAISRYNLEYLVKVLGPWVRNKTTIIHCGIAPNYYKPRNSLRSQDDRFEILSVGSLQPYKGQVYLIEACQFLREKGIPFRCRIVGDGELRLSLQNQIFKHKLEANVELLGLKTQNEISHMLPTIHCYVQPSIITPSGKMEGIPVALMEAMVCRVPVIASSISGIPELVKEGETGWLVPPEDARALADKLAHVYSDPGESKEIAEAGRQLILQEFEISTNVAQLGSLFEQYI